MARSCVDFLSLPYQSRQGRLLDQTTAALPEGAVALFSFGARLYIIGGRSFNNSALAISVRWGDETVYLAYADGIDTRGGDIKLDLLPGIYDLVKVDPFGGVVQTNVIVKEGTQLIPRSGQPFVQIVYAFPAGLLTTEELEGYIMPLNVQADWSVVDPLSAAYVQNKPNFITIDDFNLILSTTIADQIETEVTTQLVPVIAEVADTALQPADIGATVQGYSDVLDDLSSGVLKFTKTGGVDYGIDIARTITGTSVVGVNASLHNITADDAEITGGNFLNGMNFQHSWGGGQGGRQTLFALSVQTSITNDQNANRNYVAGNSQVETESGDGGISTEEVYFPGTLTDGSPTVSATDTAGLAVGMTIHAAGIPGGATIQAIVANTSVTMSKNAESSGSTTILGRGPRGAYFAHAFLAHAKAGATNLLQLAGAEVNVRMDAGSSVRHKIGWSIVGHELDAVEGSVTNALLALGNQAANALWSDGILFSDYGGAFPLKATASVLRTTASTFLNGIDFSASTVTGHLLKGAAVRVRDSGGFAIFGGTSDVVIQSAGHNVLAVLGVSGGDTQIALIGQGAGDPAYFATSGPATDIDFIVRAKNAGTLDVDFPTAATVGAAGTASALPTAPLGYATIKVNGTPVKFPYYNT